MDYDSEITSPLYAISSYNLSTNQAIRTLEGGFGKFPWFRCVDKELRIRRAAYKLGLPITCVLKWNIAIVFMRRRIAGSGILCMYKYFHWGMRRENIKSFFDGMDLLESQKTSKCEWE